MQGPLEFKPFSLTQNELQTLWVLHPEPGGLTVIFKSRGKWYTRRKHNGMWLREHEFGRTRVVNSLIKKNLLLEWHDNDEYVVNKPVYSYFQGIGCLPAK